MNFRKATDALLESVTLQDLADALGVSLQTVRQARADEGSTAYRSPPPEWQAAARKLALRAAARYSRLADHLADD
jgi:hypothetical protein